MTALSFGYARENPCKAEAFGDRSDDSMSDPKLRIVSLLPSATDIACALGFEGAIVGRSHGEGWSRVRQESLA